MYPLGCSLCKKEGENEQAIKFNLKVQEVGIKNNSGKFVKTNKAQKAEFEKYNPLKDGWHIKMVDAIGLKRQMVNEAHKMTKGQIDKAILKYPVLTDADRQKIREDTRKRL